MSKQFFVECPQVINLVWIDESNSMDLFYLQIQGIDQGLEMQLLKGACIFHCMACEDHVKSLPELRSHCHVSIFLIIA